MSIAACSRRSRTAVFVLAVLLHMGFAVLAALPQIVFCHRTDGRVAVEFAGPAGVCTCEECEHCQARLAEAGAGAQPRGVSLEACHCRHDLILLEAARSCFLRDKAKQSLTPDCIFASAPAILPDPLRAGPAASADAALSPPVLPGTSALLRC
jgi:hypothetical protein